MVWAATWSTPLGRTALSIDPNTGNLIITEERRIVLNITDVQAGPNPNVTATLEDNGNFRLINESNKRVLWESFDHPRNILLPGMKLGYDYTTGKNWSLTSSISDLSPVQGAFTLSWEPTEHNLVIQRRGQPYWTSGKMEDQNFPYLQLNSPNSKTKYKLSYVDNNTVKYFSYSVDQDSGSEDDDGIIPMWILNSNGKITDGKNKVSWTPEFCYGLNSATGCMEDPTNMRKCKGGNQTFTHEYVSFDPSNTNSITTDRNSSLSISDCFVKCWKDCNCVGFNSSYNNETGCTMFLGSNSFSHTVASSYMAYVISARKPSPHKNGMHLVWILIGTAIALVLLCLGLLWCHKKRKHRQEEKERRRRDEYFLELTASDSFKDVHQLENNGGEGNDLLIFSVASIMAATNDFSNENKLGQGGFGPVYKGKLSDGREVAIKRLSKTSGQGLVEFKNELILISKLQHTNLVRVLDKNRKQELDWATRFNIIEGIAQGLLYLHKYSRMRVIHRDLKASNVLLDENMNPKISDFGMARIFSPNETQAMTKRVVGTFGYMSPEYVIGGTFSVKSDIFSFGVLMLEIVTGRKTSSFIHIDPTSSLIGYAWELYQKGDALELMDPSLASTCVVQQFLRTVHVALLCVQNHAADRPTTSDMISMLLNDTISLPTPKEPPFVLQREDSDLTSVERKIKDCSVNNMTITVLDAR
ncbi:G-type lectin S-receptor-like serine/threonine-protein kinase [Tanacetum coccineum]